jgi:hypothetical protein
LLMSEYTPAAAYAPSVLTLFGENRR